MEKLQCPQINSEYGDMEWINCTFRLLFLKWWPKISAPSFRFAKTKCSKKLIKNISGFSRTNSTTVLQHSMGHSKLLIHALAIFISRGSTWQHLSLQRLTKTVILKSYFLLNWN
jgi:hypothetical protein